MGGLENKHRFWLTLGLSIIGILVTIGLTLYFSDKEKEPVYYVSTPVLIAQSVNGENNLKLVWNEKEIKNAAYVNVGIWNKGRQYIDSNDIEDDNPIRIIPLDHKSKILFVNVEKTSRPDLSFNTRIVNDPSGYDYIVLTIENNDALEYMDGAYLHILYTGSVNSSWGVLGRIKGVPGGIKELSSNIIYDSHNILLAWYFLVFFIIAFVYGATRYVLLYKKNYTISLSDVAEPIFTFLICLFIIYERTSIVVQLPAWLKGMI